MAGGQLATFSYRAGDAGSKTRPWQAGPLSFIDASIRQDLIGQVAVTTSAVGAHTLFSHRISAQPVLCFVPFTQVGALFEDLADGLQLGHGDLLGLLDCNSAVHVDNVCATQTICKDYFVKQSSFREQMLSTRTPVHERQRNTQREVGKRPQPQDGTSPGAYLLLR